jgi:hypothetical protein
MITKRAMEEAQMRGARRALASYGLDKVAFNPITAVKGVGRALGMGANARGVNALSSFSMSRGLGHGLADNIGHAWQGFKQSGGAKHLGNLAIAGGLTYGAGRLAGAGQRDAQGR